MKSKRELLEARALVLAAISTMVETAENEKRELSHEEKTAFDSKTAEIAALDADITRAEQLESLDMHKPVGGTIDGEQEEINKNFSLRSMVIASLEGEQNLQGFEKEMHEEAKKEARESGLSLQGIGVPAKALEKRTAILGGADFSGTGKGLIENAPLSFIGQLQSELVVAKMGAQMLTGLTGNVPVGRGKSFDAFWVGENTAQNTSVGATDRYNLKPNRLSTLAQISRELLHQGGASEQILTSEMVKAITAKLMAGVVSGNGSTIDGILGTTGIGTVAMGTNGGAPTWAKVLEFESAIKTDAGNPMNLSYLTNGKGRAKLKGTPKLASSDSRMLWENNEVNGYAAYSNDQVPSNLTKGTGTNLSAMIFGNWADLWIGQWGGLDLITDPYSAKKSGLVELQIDTFWDIFLKQLESFAASVDMITA